MTEDVKEMIELKEMTERKETTELKKMIEATGTETAEDTSGDLMYWGSSRPMMAIRKTVDKIAPTDATVLITGENGTGKDVLAQEIHTRSLRSGKPMVAVDAGAITETLFSFSTISFNSAFSFTISTFSLVSSCST